MNKRCTSVADVLPAAQGLDCCEREDSFPAVRGLGCSQRAESRYSLPCYFELRQSELGGANVSRLLRLLPRDVVELRVPRLLSFYLAYYFVVEAEEQHMLEDPRRAKVGAHQLDSAPF